MREILRFTSDMGVEHRILKDEAGVCHDVATQENDPTLDRNRAMATHNDGYTPDRTMRRVASIPLTLVLKWKLEEGWDAFNPHHAHKLAQKLNDPQYLYLRTADGQLGLTQDGGFR